MRIARLMVLFCVTCAITGCARKKPVQTLDEAIDALTLEDADFEWGYDCGKWFRADTETGNVDARLEVLARADGLDVAVELFDAAATLP